MIILLWILKIIGIILIIISALLLLLILTILMTTIKYVIKGEKYNEFLADGKFSVWLGILKANAVYKDNDFLIEAFVFGKKIFSTNKDVEEVVEDIKDETIKVSEAVTKPIDKEVLDKSESKKQVKNQHKTYKETQINEKSIPEKKSINSESILNDSNNIETKEVHESVIRRIKINKESFKTDEENNENKDKEIDDKNSIEIAEELGIDYFIDMPLKRKKVLIKSIVKFLKRILKWVSPKESRVDLIIGTGDPALTGQALGVIAILKGTTGIDINAKGNFSDTELSGEAYLKGRMNFGVLINIVIRFVFEKEIFKIIKLYLKGMKD